MSGRKPDILFL